VACESAFQDDVRRDDCQCSFDLWCYDWASETWGVAINFCVTALSFNSEEPVDVVAPLLRKK
jgi:hypothetical protein